MTAAPVLTPDLGTLRGLSDKTLATFHVRNNGRAWEYDYQVNGVKATRAKAYDSSATPKYWFVPDKPDGAHYFYPLGYDLKREIQAASGVAYIVGGEIGVMTMFEAGIRNAFCTFGDSSVPDTFGQDCAALGVKLLLAVADRDESGLKWAVKLRDALLDQLDIELEVLALPYEVAKAHGKDVNDYWLEGDRNGAAFRQRLADLPLWRLPEPESKAAPLVDYSTYNGDLPTAFVDAIERALGDCGGFNNEGWSKKHVRCPLHDDHTPSANWNNQKHILRCQSSCGKSYLAKEVGEALGIHLRDYLTTPAVPIAPSLTVVKPAPVVDTVSTPAPVKALRPALPFGVELTAEQSREAAFGRDWLDAYLDYARLACPLAPDIFHEAMALWLLATISTRRMMFSIGGEDIYPNLYVLIVAKTSLYRKSTAMKEAKKVLRRANMEPLLLPVDATPEALFDELAGVKPANFDSLPDDDKRAWRLGRSVAAQRAFFKDECSSIFANLKKEYMGGLAELLLQGYDGDAGRITKLLKSRGQVSVKDMCLSFLGATTPVMYHKHIGTEETENGFIARFAVITPDAVPEYKVIDERVEIPARLTSDLRRLFMNVLPWHGGATPGAMLSDQVETPPVASVHCAPDALKLLLAYRKAVGYDMLRDEVVDESKSAAYTRLGTMAIKVAMLLAAIDSYDLPIRIELRHAAAAQQIVERWRESLHRLDIQVARTQQGIEEKILAYLKSAGQTGASARDIKRDCAVKDQRHFTDALNMLGDDGLIEKYEAEKRAGPGRKAWRYRVIGLNTVN